MKPKLLCLAFVLSILTLHFCHAAIIFPKGPADAQHVAHTALAWLLQKNPSLLGGAQIEELTVTNPHQNYNADPQDVISTNLLAGAKLSAGRWRYFVMRRTNAVGVAELKADKGTMKFVALYHGLGPKMLEALRRAEELPQVKEQDYEFRFLNLAPINFFAVWLHGQSDDIIIPLPPTWEKWTAYQPCSESEIIKLLRPVAENALKNGGGVKVPMPVETFDPFGKKSHAVIQISPEGTWAKKLKVPWTNTRVVLYRSSGEVVQLDAKKAVYTAWSINKSKHEGRPFDVPVTAFVDPVTKNIWIGRADVGETETNDYYGIITYTNIFFENGSQIFSGGNVLVDGTFSCNESPIKKADALEGLDAVIGQFDNSTDGAWPFGGTRWQTKVRDDFRGGFFSAVHDLGDEATPIQRFEVTNGQLRLDFKSEKFGTTGTVWLDLKKLRLAKAVEHK